MRSSHFFAVVSETLVPREIDERTRSQIKNHTAIQLALGAAVPARAVLV